ncbi:hypothetical protein H257_12845 [Aphanomyces astaci]|uniref:U-box domain-containing protein n=1 Tax=Aphanomyces astaci TaxID=112090 RepID=W4FZH2_APHAT|nr:hypothetical protein H257_12845 [Aphanomyces astaci]ETV72048.1 hypothetical protein H257_12845 [Aphanomyces astaci]RQM30118.1 hypothetical protein B5M09_007606 [Aphanomyces astaci]|eukprot:XP_009838491.1 hypothetical protein H257_12845 [Aphanomyces astaci]
MPRRSLESFVCPISQEVMKDPVVACDGHSYEREDIERWFAQKVTSPATNAPLPSSRLVPNHSLRFAIQEYARHDSRASLISPSLNSFCCPIGKTAMLDPVVASDGYSYDRANIKDRKVFLGMFTKHSKSPVTNCRLSLRQVVPNHALKQAIAEFLRTLHPLSPSSIVIFPAFSSDFSPPSPPHVCGNQLLPPPPPTYDGDPTPSFHLSLDQPPNVYRVVRQTGILWSEDVHDTMPPELARPLAPHALLVGFSRGSAFVQVDGDAIGSLVDTAYVAVADLELVEAMEVRMTFRLRRRSPLALWPTASTAHVLAWMDVGDVVVSEAVVLDATGQAFHRCQDTKCWLRICDDV